MGHHEDCFNWEYDQHPKRGEVTVRCSKILLRLRATPEAFDQYGVDTRPGHAYLFGPVAPVCCPDIVGNYRGSDVLCLKPYRVEVRMDPRVGTAPELVGRHMVAFDDQLSKAVIRFKKAREGRKGADADKAFLLNLVQILGLFLQKFLTIHPYANGNGHIGRLIVWVLLGKFGYWPQKWPLDESPSYYQALTDHRNGNLKPLNDFILKCILG